MELSNQSRLSRLLKILHSLETKVPRIFLHRIDFVYPTLQHFWSIKLKDCISNRLQNCRTCKKEFPELWKESKYFENQNLNLNLENRSIKDGSFQNGLEFVCETCNKCFYDVSLLKKHRKNCTKNGKNYVYKMCNKGFSGNSQSESPRGNCSYHSCKECGKSFNSRATLTRHWLVHINGDPYKCTLCPNAFKRLDYLRVHLNSAHGGIPYSQRRRRGKRSDYSCKECGKSFTIRSRLERHLLVHTNERPYKCTLCPLAHKRLDHLKMHLNKVHGGIPYKCQICLKMFTTPEHMEFHLQSRQHIKDALSADSL